MKSTVLIGRLMAVVLSVAMAAQAAARDLRHPTSDTPAFTLQIPDTWQHQVDPDNNLIVVSADRSTSLVFTISSLAGSLEDMAKEILQMANATPPTGKASASISGLQGFSFDSTMKGGNNVQLVVKMTIVRADPYNFASASKLEVQGNTLQQRQLADTVMRSVRIVGGQQ